VSLPKRLVLRVARPGSKAKLQDHDNGHATHEQRQWGSLGIRRLHLPCRVERVPAAASVLTSRLAEAEVLAVEVRLPLAKDRECFVRMILRPLDRLFDFLIRNLFDGPE
jgi:hypothetical protein